ncbi:unnamed protein product, partial [Meganyctiphanes norvegica]
MSRIPAPPSRLLAPSNNFGQGNTFAKRKVLTDRDTNSSPSKRSKNESTRSQVPITGRASFMPKTKTKTENVPPAKPRRASLAPKSMGPKTSSRSTLMPKTGTRPTMGARPVSKSSLVPKAEPKAAAANPVKAKPKRAAWDVKGRLLDMEAAFKDVLKEKDTNKSKFTDYNARIEALEIEKKSLNQNLAQSQTVSLAHQDKIDILKQQLMHSEDESSKQVGNLQKDLRDSKITIENLEFKNSTLERRIKSLTSELSARDEEVLGLKSTMSQLTTSQAGTEALLSSTKQILDERTCRVKELDETVSELENKIEDITRKLADGETMRRKLHNQVQELKGNIRVFCRLRPLLSDEVKANGGDDTIHHVNILDEKSLEVSKGDLNSSSMSGLQNRGTGRFDFSYDYVFGPNDGQGCVFNEIQQLVQSALDGYNVCVFAYGQTGSGKTYTMEGKHGDATHEGMIPRTVKEIFSAMHIAKEKGWTYSVAVNIMEIYNETIRDLLAPKGSANLTHEIKRVDKNTDEVMVSNLTHTQVETADHVHHLLKQANQKRAVAATNMNEHSSRSHCVFQLKITGKNSKTTESCEATLSLVDLAGSERIKESGAEGQRLTETLNINKSLANLGNVMLALGQKSAHVPYRNSKLTHLLINSLGGNSKTLMFVNLSPLDACLNETLNSLRFATKVNQCHIGTATKQIKK